MTYGRAFHDQQASLVLRAHALGRDVNPALRLPEYGFVGPLFARAHVMSVVESLLPDTRSTEGYSPVEPAARSVRRDMAELVAGYSEQ